MNITIASGLIPLAVSVGGTLLTYVGLSRKFHRSTMLSAVSVQELLARVDALTKEVDSSRQQTAEASHCYTRGWDTFTGPASLHLNRRGQVAQLFRRGATPQSIASRLGISQEEVTLIVKLQAVKRAAADSHVQKLSENSRKAVDIASVLSERKA